MLFNSTEFLFFLPTVLFLYWFIFNKKIEHQNLIIVLSSYFFYGWWDYRFLSLIFLSTVVDYYVGLKIYKESSLIKKKKFLLFSISINIGMLGVFKYYNFFVESWLILFSSLGYDIQSLWTLNIILPVGISFYTFQTLSYTIDIYKNKLEPTKNFISFASFVCFFPQLVAGPIERATNLLPQILNKREVNLNQITQGLKLILWGLFKKVVIADSLSPIVNDIFDNYQNYNGFDLWLGAIYFAFQIYCDFSGYSDIAIGTAKLFGFELMSNFKFPYFSRNIGEFWRRWHISLSTWFRDYLYIPLGGSKQSRWISLRNIFIIFTISGFWHGANWTFIVWGIFHSVLFIPSFLLKNNRKNINSIVAQNKLFPSFLEIYKVASTFILVTIGWIFFRSQSVQNSIEYLINGLKLNSDFDFPPNFILSYLIILIIIEWNGRYNERDVLGKIPKKLTFITLLILIYLIIINFTNEPSKFIYFDF